MDAAETFSAETNFSFENKRSFQKNNFTSLERSE
jgi:hypothetical protein